MDDTLSEPVAEHTEPAGAEPTEPAGSEHTEPAGDEPAEPAGDEPAEPAGVEPTEPVADEQCFPQYDFNEDKLPAVLAHSAQCFGRFFLKGCSWSPHGTHLLTCCDDRRLRVLPLPTQFYTGDFSSPIPEMEPSLVVKEGGTVYDYCWNPTMHQDDPESCYFITTSKNCPIHLWDSNNGALRSTYRPVNRMEELDTARSLAITPDGQHIYSGFHKKIEVFDVNQPGKQIEEFRTHKKRSTGQIGIISCFDFLPQSQIFAAGSYGKSVAVYDQRNNTASMIFEGHVGGVTQVRFSQEGRLLFSGARKDGELLAWDMRNPGQILAILQRDVQTNQRMYFDLDPSSRYICSGNHDGSVRIWDLYNIDFISGDTEQDLSPTLSFQANSDCVNGCSFHPSLALLATTSGQRSYPSALPDSSDSDDGSAANAPDALCQLWWLGH